MTSNDKTLEEQFHALYDDALMRSYDQKTKELERQDKQLRAQIKEAQSAATRTLKEGLERLKKRIRGQRKTFERVYAQEKELSARIDDLALQRDTLQERVDARKKERARFVKKRADLSSRIVGRVDTMLSAYEKHTARLGKQKRELEASAEMQGMKTYDFEERSAKINKTLESLLLLPTEDRPLYEWKIEVLREQKERAGALLHERKDIQARVNEAQNRIAQKEERTASTLSYWKKVHALYSNHI